MSRPYGVMHDLERKWKGMSAFQNEITKRIKSFFPVADAQKVEELVALIMEARQADLEHWKIREWAVEVASGLLPMAQKRLDTIIEGATKLEEWRTR
jgi:hypothetical protein